MSDYPEQGETHGGPGEQIRPRDDAAHDERENFDLDNLRGGADPSGGHSKEVPRENGRNNPGALAGGQGEIDRQERPPLSPPVDRGETARPTEDDLARQENAWEDGDE